jgi:hypothetical protein
MTAGQQYLVKESKQLSVEINPRYGSWDSSQLSITDFINPVVKATPTPAATSTAPGGAGDGSSAGDGSGAGDGTGGGATPSPTGG